MSSSLKETKDYTRFDLKSNEEALKRDFKKATIDEFYDLVAFEHKDNQHTNFQLRKNSKILTSGFYDFLNTKQSQNSHSLVNILKDLIKKYEYEQAKSAVHTSYSKAISAQMALLQSSDIDTESVMNSIEELKKDMENEMSKLNNKYNR